MALIVPWLILDVVANMIVIVVPLHLFDSFGVAVEHVVQDRPPLISVECVPRQYRAQLCGVVRPPATQMACRCICWGSAGLCRLAA